MRFQLATVMARTSPAMWLETCTSLFAIESSSFLNNGPQREALRSDDRDLHGGDGIRQQIRIAVCDRPIVLRIEEAEVIGEVGVAGEDHALLERDVLKGRQRGILRRLAADAVADPTHAHGFEATLVEIVVDNRDQIARGLTGRSVMLQSWRNRIIQS